MLDLRNYFTLSGVSGQIVQFSTVLGKINVELYASDAPENVANFLSYVAADAYANTIVHRSEPGFVIQGGGYLANNTLSAIARPTMAKLEYKLPNIRGTIAMARGSDINSASCEWYFNLVDNTTTLGPANGGGYTVFGRVIGSGMTVVDAIAALPRVNLGSPFTVLPLYNYTSGDTPAVSNLVSMSSIRTVPAFPATAGQAAVANFSVSTENSSAAIATVSGSQLTITPGAMGTARITVRATDSNGNVATSAFDAVVTQGAVVAPTIVAQPQSVTVLARSTVALAVAATGTPLPTFQWRKDGLAINGATEAQLLLPEAVVADTGSYTVAVTNSGGTAISSAATVSLASGDPSRLANLSVRASVVSGKTLIVGFVTNGTKDILVRAVGPGLSFIIPNYYENPLLELYNPADALIATNDDWGASLEPTFDRVGAFRLPANSKDAALLRAVDGKHSAHLKGTGSNIALVEVYDAGTGMTPRLINVSARNSVGIGSDILIAGFVVDGPVAKTLLIRGVGAKLAQLGVTGALTDPKLTVFDEVAGVKRAENDSWSISSADAAARVGAFPLDAGSKDAAVLVTLPPGRYTAQVAGAGSSTGEALVEVYEVP